jgi:hypothetical protein
MSGIMKHAPDPTLVGYSWGTFIWQRKSTDRASEPRNLLTYAYDSLRLMLLSLLNLYLLAAIYSLQLANYLYSSISMMESQEYCV